MTFNIKASELKNFVIKNNTHIPGLGSKIISFYFKKFNTDFLFSYSDNRYCSEKFHSSVGFTKLKLIEPAYEYINSKFTERTDLVTAYKIFDCGKTKWCLTSSHGKII